MSYPVILTIHLLCAIVFIGVVFFEVVLIEGVRKKLSHSIMEQFEPTLMERARKIMPWVVVTLFVSGIGLASFHWQSLKNPLASSFATLLILKILLAFSVLGHFIAAIRAAKKGCMSSARSRRTHFSVGIHMFFIVILAKGMFYISW